MTNQIGIYDHATGETIVREMTSEEVQVRDEQIAAYQAKENERLTNLENEKLAKEALHAKLGITEDEARLLLS